MHTDCATQGKGGSMNPISRPYTWAHTHSRIALRIVRPLLISLPLSLSLFFAHSRTAAASSRRLAVFSKNLRNQRDY